MDYHYNEIVVTVDPVKQDNPRLHTTRYWLVMPWDRQKAEDLFNKAVREGDAGDKVYLREYDNWGDVVNYKSVIVGQEGNE